MECIPREGVRKKYVGIFGFASTKYPNEDSQTLGNKKPSLHRKATELQAPSSQRDFSASSGGLMDRYRVDLRSVDWKIGIMGYMNGSLNCRTRSMINRITSCKQEERDHEHRSVVAEGKGTSPIHNFSRWKASAKNLRANLGMGLVSLGNPFEPFLHREHPSPRHVLYTYLL
jgi:hypothetical protein